MPFRTAEVWCYTFPPHTREDEMDDLYAINVAKTQFREAYNLGDPERIAELADPGMVEAANGRQWGFGADGVIALQNEVKRLAAKYEVDLKIIIIEIRIVGDLAYDYGWHLWTLKPKDGGTAVQRKDRYVDIWNKNEKGEWKLQMYMDNPDFGLFT